MGNSPPNFMQVLDELLATVGITELGLWPLCEQSSCSQGGRLSMSVPKTTGKCPMGWPRARGPMTVYMGNLRAKGPCDSYQWVYLGPQTLEYDHSTTQGQRPQRQHIWCMSLYILMSKIPCYDWGSEAPVTMYMDILRASGPSDFVQRYSMAHGP